MIIIVEGGDKTGKTTFVNELKKIFKNRDDILFFTPNDYKPFLNQEPDFLENAFYGDWVLLLDFLYQITDGGKKKPHIIMERSFITEAICGKISSEKPLPKWFYHRILYYNQQLSKFKHLVIYAYTHLAEPEDDRWNKEQLYTIYKEYKDYFKKWSYLLTVERVNLFDRKEKQRLIKKLKGIL